MRHTVLKLLAGLLVLACSISGGAQAGEAAPVKKTGRPSAYGEEETESVQETDQLKRKRLPRRSERAGEALKEENAPASEYTIQPAEWEAVEWTKYANLYFTLEIPKGWEVQWEGSAEQLFWSAEKPGSMTGLSNVDHLTAPKTQQMANLLGMAFYLREGTVEEMFGKMYAESTDHFTVQNSCVPADREELQALRRDKRIWDYRALYATFSQGGTPGEGIYSAVIMEAPDLILGGGYNYAMWEINAVFAEFAPLGELVNWQPVLDRIARSFTYTDYYMREWQMRLGTDVRPSSPVSNTGSVLEAFEERSREDTILQEKRSDMLGEFERVYDSDSGNIYRAYSGFLEDLGADQTRFSPVTDSQYTQGYAGWIEK